MKKNQLAQKVKSLRKNKGYSQEALAEISGLSLRTVQRIENENRNPSGDSLQKLSSALEVPPDYLLEWQPSENPNFLLILALSPILCIINPFLAILAPLLLWLMKKNNFKGVKRLGIRILKIQITWLVVYFSFRTINFLRLQYIIRNTKAFVGNNWNSFLSDIETQSFLKTFFIGTNIFITLFIAYKTYKSNQTNKTKLTLNRAVMKSYLFLFIIITLVACNNKTQTTSHQYIEPSEYYIMGYQVKSAMYHDSVKHYLTDSSYISIIGDSIFNITDDLGKFLFDETNFTYTISNDSLILSNNRQRLSHKIDLSPNLFKIELNNKYFKRIDLIKPKEKRRKIQTTVKIEY